jgi:hypothetical protein
MNPYQNLFGDLASNIQLFLYNTGLLQWLNSLASRSPVELVLYFMIHGGWVIVVIMFAWVLYKDVFLEYRSGQFVSKWKFVLLAIDIPKNNEQTPKAVENVFAALAGVYTSYNLFDRYWNGRIMESFSFEVVSIEGYTRFLVRTPTHFRDFIESNVYSQYPDAEINEVSDYVDYDSEEIDPKTGKPLTFRELKFPNKIYNLWGAEFVFVKSYPYPIRTYPEFEHQQTQQLIDPMANLLEILSKIGPSEQVWLQLVVQPRAPGWGEEAKKVLAKVQGKEYKAPESFDYSQLVNKPVEGGIKWTAGLIEHATGIGLGATPAETKKEEDQWKMFRMSPGERSVLEKIENKISKQAFKVKFRMVYVGKRENFAKGRGVTGITGALQQFNTSDANALKPGAYTKTGADYFFVDSRIAKKQNRILRWYCNRTAWYGETNAEDKLTLMCPEELASLWHFPVITVKASQLEKIGSKRAAPPTRLPYMQRIAPAAKPDAADRRPQSVVPMAPIAPFNAPPTPTVPAYEAPLPAVPSVSPVAPVAPISPADSGSAGSKGVPPSNLPFA